MYLEMLFAIPRRFQNRSGWFGHLEVLFGIAIVGKGGGSKRGSGMVVEYAGPLGMST